MEGSCSACYQPIVSLHLVTFPSYISRVNFLEISAAAVGAFASLEAFWIVSPSCSDCRIFHDFHKSIWRSNAFKCSLDFDF